MHRLSLIRLPLIGKRLTKQALALTSAALLLLLSACAHNTSRNLDGLIRYNPSIQRTTLDNGFRSFLLPNKNPDKAVYMRLVVDAGSLHEDDDQKGVAHFVEHMAFNGTENYPGNSVIAELEKAGMKFGLDVNAYTDFENTVYKLNLPDNKPETMALALDIIADWSGRVTIRPEDVDGERGVILEEWRSRLGPMLRLGDAKSAVDMAGSRYLLRDPIGSVDVINHVSVSRVRDFYQRWYRPDNMSLVVAGDFDPDELQAMVAQRFDYLKKTTSTLPEIDFSIPAPEGWRVAPVTAEGVKEPTLELGFVRRADQHVTIERYRSDLASGIATRLLNLRLQEWEEHHESIASAGFFDSPLGRENNQSLFSLPLNNEDFPVAAKALFAMLAAIDQQGFLPEEIAAERNRLLRVVKNNRQKEDSSPELASDLVISAATGQLLFAKEDEFTLNEQLLNSLTDQEVNQAYRAILQPPSRLLLMTHAEDSPAPELTSAEVERWWQEAMTIRQPIYQQPSVEGSLPEFEGEPGKLWEERHWPEQKITEYRLSNGSKLVYRYSDDKAGRVYFRAETAGGLLSVPAENFHQARITTSLVDETGIGGLSYKVIQKIINGRLLGLTTLFDENLQGYSGWADQRDVGVLMHLFRLKLASASVSEKVLAQYRRDMKGQLADKPADPWFSYASQVEARRFPGQPGAYSLDSPTLAGLNARQLADTYQKLMQQRTDYTYYITGDIEPNMLLPLVRRYLASVPVNTQPLNLRQSLPATEQPRLTVLQNQEPRAEVEIYLTAVQPWSFTDSLRLSVAGELVQDELRAQLREEASGVYGVSSWFWQNAHEDYASARIGFSCDPARVDELIDLTYTVLDQLAARELSSEVLNNKMRQQQDQYQGILHTGQGWLDAVTLSYRVTDSPFFLKQEEQLYETMDVKNVEKTLSTFLNNSDRFEALLTNDNLSR